MSQSQIVIDVKTNVSSPLMSILLHGLKRESSEQAKTVKHKASMTTIIYEEGILRGKKNAHKKK